MDTRQVDILLSLTTRMTSELRDWDSSQASAGSRDWRVFWWHAANKRIHYQYAALRKMRRDVAATERDYTLIHDLEVGISQAEEQFDWSLRCMHKIHVRHPEWATSYRMACGVCNSDSDELPLKGLFGPYFVGD